MEFGIATGFANPRSLNHVPSERFVQIQLEHAVLAEELGYGHIWLAQHPGTDLYYPAPFPLLAAMAVKTHRIRLGTYIVILPLHHPLQVAEEAVTLDVLSGGRFELGLGAGNFIDDFRWYGVSRTERGSRMEEGLAIVKGLWEQEDFSFEGRHWSFPPITVNPRPVQKKAPLWVGATVPKAAERAARFGAHLAAGSGAGFQIYDETLRERGYDPADFSHSLLQPVHVAEDREQAWRQVGPAILHFLQYYKREFDRHADFELFRRQPGGYFGVDPLPSPDDLDALRRLTFLGVPLAVGTPEDMVGMVEAAQSQGITHLALAMLHPGMDPAHVEESIRLFARDVMPRFRD